MTVNMKQALLDIASRIGRELSEPELPYPTALDLLAEVEDSLRALSGLTDYAGLSGSPNGYLPTRHPNKHAAEPLRPEAQTADFTEDNPRTCYICGLVLLLDEQCAKHWPPYRSDSKRKDK